MTVEKSSQTKLLALLVEQNSQIVEQNSMLLNALMILVEQLDATLSQEEVATQRKTLD